MIKKKSILVMSNIFLLVYSSSSVLAEQTGSAICKKLSDTVGIYYVSNDKKLEIRKLHDGSQRIPWSNDNWIYFVVGENNGAAETVDHFRVMTTDTLNPIHGEIAIGLDRSSAKSPCNAGWFGFFGVYGDELHKQTTIDNYDKRLHKEFKYIDNNLNAWHFKWNVARPNQDVLCDHTAGHTPAILGNSINQPGTPGLVGPAIASVFGAPKALPRDVSSLRMVLVHRKIDENSCLAVKLKPDDSAKMTQIHRLRFSNTKLRFSGQGTVIEWVQ